MNQRGSITPLLLVPLLVTILTTLAASISTLIAFQKSQKLCRSLAISAQEIQGEALEKILQLNPTAKSLRIQEKALKAAIAAAAVTPGAQATLDKLYLSLRAIQAAQKTLDVKQKTILFTANQRSTSMASSKTPQLPARKLRLRIHAKTSEPAPEYDLDMNFERAQTLSYNYKLVLKNVLPGWLIKFFYKVSDLDMECSSTLKQKEKKWRPALNAVNSY